MCSRGILDLHCTPSCVSVSGLRIHADHQIRLQKIERRTFSLSTAIHRAAPRVTRERKQRHGYYSACQIKGLLSVSVWNCLDQTSASFQDSDESSEQDCRILCHQWASFPMISAGFLHTLEACVCVCLCVGGGTGETRESSAFPCMDEYWKWKQEWKNMFSLYCPYSNV